MIRFMSTSRSAAAAALVLSILIPTSLAHAQERSAQPTGPAPASLAQQAIEHARKAALEPSASQSQVAKVQATKRERSTTRKIVGAAIGATAGLFAGGWLGATIEGDSCHCDDPGLQGALIGAPIGMVLGGILGAVFF